MSREKLLLLLRPHPGLQPRWGSQASPGSRHLSTDFSSPGRDPVRAEKITDVRVELVNEILDWIDRSQL